MDRSGIAKSRSRAPNQARIQDGFQDGVMTYLIYLYRLTGKDVYLKAARRVADLFIRAQNPNGSWSGLYDVKAKKSRIADNEKVWQGGEFDDGAIRRPFWSLVLMYHVTKDEKYLKPLPKAANWIIQAEKEQVPAPVIAGLVHYQFVTIHPFYDGNGRTARALATLILYRHGYGLGRLQPGRSLRPGSGGLLRSAADTPSPQLL